MEHVPSERQSFVISSIYTNFTEVMHPVILMHSVDLIAESEPKVAESWRRFRLLQLITCLCKQAF